MMISVENLLKQFNIKLDLPNRILKFEFEGNYTKCSKKTHSFIENHEYYEFIDIDDNYKLQVSIPDSDYGSLNFYRCNAPEGNQYQYPWNENYDYNGTTVVELLDKFNIKLDLPRHILRLNFAGNYTKYNILDDDPFYPDEVFHQFIDEDNGYVISISLPEGEVRSLEFWDGYYPDIEYDSEWEESYSYDDETIPNNYINN